MLQKEIRHHPLGQYTVVAAQTDVRCYTSAQVDNLLREQFRLDGREFTPPGDAPLGEDEGGGFVQTVWFWVMIAVLSGGFRCRYCARVCLNLQACKCLHIVAQTPAHQRT